MFAKRVVLTVCLAALSGCATTGSSPNQVKELEPGVYSVGIGHSITQGHSEQDDAVEKAGAYCHAKGQKLAIMPGTSGEIRFRCVPSTDIMPSPKDDGSGHDDESGH
jgi:hypothetical protein